MYSRHPNRIYLNDVFALWPLDILHRLNFEYVHQYPAKLLFLFLNHYYHWLKKWLSSGFLLQNIANYDLNNTVGGKMAHSNSGEDFLKNFKIPKYVLVPKSESENVPNVPDVPQCPVLVFINSRSGGQLGGDLLVTYRSLLNETQVLIYFFLFCMVKCC